ncbi:DUF3794 domain-containing protein [Neglectibacter caecimuris]|uniref:DUF3794 domain-containing protein n=1 Tax=Neglectibacter caecimuris TaxID=3093658 RepID=UPI002AC94AAD|nr:DUF3794 domain-containing protein [Neglectibacter sp. M00184]
MQAKIKTQPYEYFDPVFDGSFEAPIDTEYNLPDYCPEIQKLLKCQAIPEISSYMISEDTLTCEGVCDIRVLYLDSKGDCVRCCDFTKEFSASVKIKATEEKAVAWVQAAVDHMTCRAVSARRIDLHIAVSVKALAVVQKQELITCGIEDDSIEKLSTTYPVSQAVNALCHQFTIEDTLSLKNGKPSIETILRKNIFCRISDHRCSEGKLTVSGSAELSFLYLSAVDGSSIEKMSASIGIEQEIDCSGAESGCICDLKAVIGESSIQPREDDVGEYTSVHIVAKVFLVAFLYKPCEIEMIDDAYSVRAPLELRYAQNSFTQAQSVHTEVLKKKCALSVQEDEIERILDIWCEQDSVQSVCDKGKLNFRVRYTVCMLYLGSGGRVLYAEKPFDYNCAAELEDSLSRKSDTVSRTEIWEYRITDKNTVEISVETPTTTFLYSRTSIKYLTAAGVAEDAECFEREPKLLVYYASSGERLWDIAKSHRSLLSDIRAQNDLYDETVPEDRPIIICSR